MVVGFEETVLLTNVVEQADVILIGPGLGLDATAQQILKMVLAQHQKQQWLIIDGSAITLFSQGNFPLPILKSCFHTSSNGMATFESLTYRATNTGK